jgi:hypothetical protein
MSKHDSLNRIEDFLLYNNIIYKLGSRYCAYHNTIDMEREWQIENFVFNQGCGDPCQFFPFGIKWCWDFWCWWKNNIVSPSHHFLFRVLPNW